MILCWVNWKEVWFIKNSCQRSLEWALQKLLKLLWKWFWRSMFTIIIWEDHWKNSVKGSGNIVSSTLKQITFPSFQIIKRALRILGTMPVTSSICEMSFSSMKLLQTYIRATMTNNRLNALVLLYVHPNIHPSSEEVLQKYAEIGLHRMRFD